MTANTPRFGPKLDPDEHRSHMENFEAEMYSFTDDKRERDRYVNVLHLGTDLGAARPEMDRIVRRMGKWGYAVKHETDVGLSNDGEMYMAGIDTDMLILGGGAARHASAYYVLRCVSMGWFGIVPYWDMLWYGTDYRQDVSEEWLKQHHMGPSALPLFSGRKFALDAVCLAHGHIRRRYDRSALSGTYVDIMRAIEGRINGLMAGAWTIRTTQTRFEEFKGRVKGDGHSGPDVELFFATLDMLLHSRNIGAHLVWGPPQEEIKRKQEQSEKMLANFDGLAKKHGRLLSPPIVSSKADSYLHEKWEYSVAHMAITWLEEYSVLSTSP